MTHIDLNAEDSRKLLLTWVNSNKVKICNMSVDNVYQRMELVHPSMGSLHISLACDSHKFSAEIYSKSGAVTAVRESVFISYLFYRFYTKNYKLISFKPSNYLEYEDNRFYMAFGGFMCLALILMTFLLFCSLLVILVLL